MKNNIEAYLLGVLHMVVTIALSALGLMASAFTGLSFFVFWNSSIDLLIVLVIAISTLVSLLIFKSRLSKCGGIGRVLFGALIIPFLATVTEIYVIYSVPTLTDTFSLLAPLSAYVLVTIIYLLYLSKTKSI
jgi:hypothetical protein